MPKLKISERQMIEIISKNDRGFSVGVLAKQYNVHPCTIRRRLALYEKDGLIGKKKIKRKLKLNLNDKARLEKYMRSMPFSSLEEVKESLNLPYCKRSLSKYCKSFGLRRGITPKKFYIKPINCELRVSFARRRLNWSKDLWKKIVFTDESGIDNSGFQKQHVWRPANSRYNDDYVYHAPNMTLRVNFFSWITIAGTGQLLTYDKMNSEVYCQEILPVMIRDLREQFGEDFLVIHDNARFSNSEFTKKYLVENDLRKYFLSIPPYSPDMNIIENV